MYKNIGGKIKGVARACCILGIIFSCLMGLILIAAGLISVNQVSRYDSSAAATTMIVTVIGGVLIAGLGSLLSWLGTFMLYGFGQQVQMQEKSADLLEQIYGTLKHDPAPQPVIYQSGPPKAEPPIAVAEPAPVAVDPACPTCGAKVKPDAAFCTNCGTKL